MESADIFDSVFSWFCILPEILAGERPSISAFSTKFLSSEFSTIFIPWYFAYFLRTYALWWAFFGSYDPFILFSFNSYDKPDTARLSIRAISRSEYPFPFKIASSYRSLLERCENFFCFFHSSILPNFSTECSNSSAESGSSTAHE